MAWITLDHLVCWFEACVGDLPHGELLVVRLLSGDHGRVHCRVTKKGNFKFCHVDRIWKSLTRNRVILIISVTAPALLTDTLMLNVRCYDTTTIHVNPSWKFRNIFMKARTLSSIFLNFSILSYWFLNIHLYRAFGSKLPHTFFYSDCEHTVIVRVGTASRDYSTKVCLFRTRTVLSNVSPPLHSAQWKESIFGFFGFSIFKNWI
jgi:hypothetical protein